MVPRSMANSVVFQQLFFFLMTLVYDQVWEFVCAEKALYTELHPSPASSAVLADWGQTQSEHVFWQYKGQPEGRGVQCVWKEVITHDV